MSNANAMNPEALRAKYGDTKVGVVPAESVSLNAGLSGLLRDLHRNLDFLPRWQMETDPSYLQPIPYVLVMNERGEYLATWRKQGDDRLVGMISLGIGGHMDEGEHDIQETLYRELNEELILNGMDAVSYTHLAIGHIDLNECICAHIDRPAGDANAPAL